MATSTASQDVQKMVDDKVQRILSTRSITELSSESTVNDSSWVKQSFLITDTQFTDADKVNQFWCSADSKYTNTTPGGNFQINPRPQFTRYADIKAKGRFSDAVDVTVGTDNVNLGMGMYYSDAFDDNAQRIHMRFGVPAYNSLTTFFSQFYNYEAGVLARNARSTGVFYTAGKIAFYVVAFTNIYVVALSLFGAAARFFMNKPSSKYYYLKPAMTLYWNAVSAMVNQILANKGITPKSGIGVLDKFISNVSNRPDQENESINGYYGLDQQSLTNFHKYIPSVFGDPNSLSAGIDVYAMANRATRMKIRQDLKIANYLANNAATASSDFTGFVQVMGKDTVTDPGTGGLTKAIQNWAASQIYSKTDGIGYTEKTIKNETSVDSLFQDSNEKAGVPQGNTSTTNSVSSDDTNSFTKAMLDEFNDGSAFATFQVDYTGPTSESFQNSVRESDIQSKLNSISSDSRSTMFTFENGNILGGAVGAVTDGIKSAVSDFVGGVTDGVGISGLMALAGAAFVDIPKYWDSSSASLPRGNYNIQLISPYGHPMAQMINIWIPLCMLLAGALPLATGKQSHTSPFICELYDRGKVQTRLGMIDQISITRGTSNLGYNREWAAMAVDVSFSVVDLSSVISMPLNAQLSLNPLQGIFDDENIFTDYMAILSGNSLTDSYFKGNQLKLNLSRSITNFGRLLSPSMQAMWVHENTPVGMLDMLFPGTARR